MRELINSLWTDEAGQAAAEYSIIASLIAAVIVTVVAVLGTEVVALFETAADAFLG